ncbi:DUF6518 family protein [Kineococcus aurantiacus]|uniref:Uncharacterized protein n=1 Tax=Kineococcus aurantiacus TaxID=37633 RepID=A0A7Y9J151_9ACTN|nr:hypothetical protein [Kineococcus aurantiacus]
MSDPTTTSPPRTPRRAPGGPAGRASRTALGLGVALGVALLAGLAWGAATSGLQTVLPRPFAALANAVGPWVVPAFAVGALCRRWPVAVAAGVLACLGEVAGYYAVSAARGFGVGAGPVLLWAATGLVGGLVLGVAGWLWRRAGSPRRAALGAALLGGVFLAEGAVTHGWYLRHTGEAVLFCLLGAVLVAGLGATAPAARATGGWAGARAAAAWSALVLPLGVAGEVGLHALVA